MSRSLSRRGRSPARGRSTASLQVSQELVIQGPQEIAIVRNSAANLVEHALRIMLSERTQFSERNMRIYVDGYEPEIRQVLSRIPPSSITVEIEDAVINLLDLYQEFITGYIDHNEYHRKYEEQMSRIRIPGYSTRLIRHTVTTALGYALWHGLYPMYEQAVNLMTQALNLSIQSTISQNVIVGFLRAASIYTSVPEDLSSVLRVPIIAANAFIRTITGGLVDNFFGIITSDKLLEVIEDVKRQSFEDGSLTSRLLTFANYFIGGVGVLTEKMTGADITKKAIYNSIYLAMEASERLGQLLGYLLLLIVFIGIICIIYKLSRYYSLKRKVERRKMEIIQLNFGRKSNKNKSKSRKASRKTSKRKSRKTSKRKSRKTSKRKSKSRKASRRKSKSRKASKRKSKSHKTSKRKYTTKKVCNEFLKKKIAINIGEFPTRARAVAVSYSQTNKKFPRCSRFFKKSK